MPGENPYLYGQPTTNGAPQPPAYYPPPPGYPGAPQHASPQNQPPARSAFADVPVSDYVRDGVAGILLFLSFFLPWTQHFGIARGGSGGIIALVVLLTLLSLSSLGLPYFARLGMLGQNWQVGQIRVLRLALNGPLAATVAVFLLYDVIRGMFRFSETSAIISGDGIGSAAWFAVVGALLAAQPRTAELAMDSRSGSRWLGWIRPVIMVGTGFAVVSGLLSLIFVLVTAGRYNADGGETLQRLVVVIASVAIPVLVVGAIAAGVASQFHSWRLTIAGTGLTLLVAGFFVSFDEYTSVELFHDPFGRPYYSVTFLVAAGAIAFLPFGLPSVSDATHAGYVWLDAARNGVRIIALWSFGTAVLQFVGAIVQAVSSGSGVGEAIALGVFALLIGILAIVGTKSLAFRYNSPDPRPSREVVIGICLGLLLLMIGRLVTQSIMYDSDFPSIGLFDVATAAATVLIALAVAFAPAVRDLYSGVPLFASVTAGPAPAGYGHSEQQPQSRPAPETQQVSGPAEWASDPNTPASTLYRIANDIPELRPAVAANPSTYDDLLTWLGTLGDSNVDKALARRSAGQFGLPAEPATASVPPGGAPSVSTPSASTAVLGSGASSEAVTVKRSPQSIASDPNTPAAELFEIATNSPELRAVVASNPSTYDDLVVWLGKLGDPDVDAALVRRRAGQFGAPVDPPDPISSSADVPTNHIPSLLEPAPAVEVLSAARAEAEPSDRERSAADPKTAAGLLFDIASNSPELRSVVAANPSTYHDLLDWLGKLGDPAVDAALARRTGESSASRTEAMDSPEQTVDSESAPVATGSTSSGQAIVEEIVEEPDGEADVDEDRAAVSDPTCSAAVLFRVAEHRPDLRATVAAHPNAYPGLLSWLGGLGDAAVNAALGRRP
ncbi:variant leucine-rich repeat-containing protein [Rhodococcoides fascians]|uniref:variant leucine-rich repeat-containing protein n=1 Tax=Rhodococcoides fascians TaxID=1828 RepID=UPI0012D355F1|nr:hypothetical protein [Rhodococcus fascians]